MGNQCLIKGELGVMVKELNNLEPEMDSSDVVVDLAGKLCVGMCDAGQSDRSKIRICHTQNAEEATLTLRFCRHSSTYIIYYFSALITSSQKRHYYEAPQAPSPHTLPLS